MRRLLLRAASVSGGLAALAGLGLIGLHGCGSAPRVALSRDLPRPLVEPVKSSYPLALVLGSGGPRGFAHIGVLEALERLGIRPDLVVGTSMGALIGALYASGIPARNIWDLVREARPISWASDLTWNRYGWLTGEGLERDVDRAVGGRSIESLPVRFVAVATCLPTGERTEFAFGNVGTAVRASSSVIGTFVPVQIGDRVYGDGDLVAPVPVATAKRMGARRIIAIDVSASLSDTPDWGGSYPNWIATGIFREHLIREELPLADVPIRVHMRYYASGNDEYKEYARAAGVAAIDAAVPQLRAAGILGGDR